MQRIIGSDQSLLGLVGPSWRVQIAATWAAFALFVLALSGCGGPEDTAVPPDTLNRRVLHLQQGESVDQVKSQIGEPDVESSAGSNEYLSYGIWQLAFIEGRLEARSRVIIPSGDPSVMKPRELSRLVRALHLGTGVREVQALLGAPEAVYLTYEGDAQPVRVLRYAPWELTFVGGALTLRAQ
jgi:hypothetical protein